MWMYDQRRKEVNATPSQATTREHSIVLRCGGRVRTSPVYVITGARCTRLGAGVDGRVLQLVRNLQLPQNAPRQEQQLLLQRKEIKF